MGVSVFDMQATQHNWSAEETRAILDERARPGRWLDIEAALGGGLADAMRTHPDIAEAAGDAGIATTTGPAGYLGETGASIDRVLARAGTLGWTKARGLAA